MGRLANARRNTHRVLPDVQSGWALDPARGWFSVLAPAGRTNLIANPSVETNTTGWAASQGAETLARTVDQQRRGAYSLKITPTTTDNQGAYHAVNLTADTLYGVGVDLLGAPGVTYRVSILTTGGAAIATFPLVDVRATGRWQRVTLMGTVTSTTTYRLYIRRRGTSSAPFYVDGAQVEAGLPSTYFDGDSRGFVRGQAAFYWVGTPHASQSVRSGQTRAGGVPMKLTDLGFTLLAITGLGMGPMRNVALDFGYLDGASYERTVIDPRAFQLVGSIEGHSMLDLQLKRKALIDAFKPDVTGFQQPLVLQYEFSDQCGALAGETLNLVCVPDSPLTGSLDNDYQERLALPFTMYLPYLLADGSQAVELDPADAQSGGFAIQGSTDGVWTALGGSGFNSGVWAIAPDYFNGRVYFGGEFTTANGVTVNGVCYLDLAAGTYHAMGGGTVGVSGGTVLTLAVAANGDVWVGGNFTAAGGSAAKGLARYNAAANTWTAFNNATTTFSQITTLALDPDGDLYGGGDFTNWNGDANQDHIWKYDTGAGTFAALGTGMNGAVNTIVPTGRFFAGVRLVYVGGSFTTGNGVTLNRIGIWFGSTFVTVQGAGTIGLNAAVTEIRQDALTGEIHVIGSFTDSHVSAYYAVHNGQPNFFGAWRAGYDSSYTMVAPRALTLVPKRGVYLGFEGGAGPGTSDDQMLLVPYPGALPTGVLTGNSAAIVQVMETAPDGSVYVGASDNALLIDVPGEVTLTNAGQAKAYPTFQVSGLGTLRSLVNQTTGAAIYFNDYVLQDGETLTLTLQPGAVSLVSSFNGNIINAINAASAVSDFYLVPGENTISLFVSNETPDATLLQWQPQYHSIEGALP